MERKLKILHLEDLPADAELVARELRKGNIAFESIVVDTRDEYIGALESFAPDIILSDHSLPSFNSMEALNIIKKLPEPVPFILVTATVSEEFAVAVIKEGAFDYILKDRLQRLPGAVMQAVQHYQLARERREYMNAVIENEALMKEAEQLAHFGSWFIDLEKNTSKWSDEALRIHGNIRNTTNFSLDYFFDQIYADDLETIKSTVQESFRNKQKLQKLDYRVTDKDGSIRYLVSEWVVTYNAAGAPARIHGFSQDITERKKTEDALRDIAERKKEEERLKKTMKQIADFVRHASHELRTPLATMLLQTETALKKELTAEETKNLLESLKEEQEKLIELTNALLMLSKYDETTVLARQPVLRIDELIYEAMAAAKKNFPDININMVFVNDAYDESQLLLACNETLLLTAFTNLIKNAYLYSDNKTIAVKIEIVSNKLNIHFENTGRIIAEAEREKIFFPMVRGENAVVAKGFGLGLSIVKRIAMLHKGDINYEAVGNNINRFTLTFLNR